MKLDEYLAYYKKAKVMQKHTGYLGVKVQANPERTRWTLYKTATCSRCHNETTRQVVLDLHKPKTTLTIFEAEALYSIFGDKRKPADYANWHKCGSGKGFIANIASVRVWEEE